MRRLTVCARGGALLAALSAVAAHPARAQDETRPCPRRAASTATQTDTAYDVVIRNGCVLDGEGNPAIYADVAIRDGRFAKIGRIDARGKIEIDATGKYVSPGWIDMMDQSGSVLPRNGLAENKLREGVTTAIGGE